MSEPIDPRKLTPALKTALMNVHDFRPYRSNGGYGRFPESFVALKTAQRLRDMNLVRVHHSGPRAPQLLLTGAGQNTWAVMMERMKGRRA